MALADPKAIIKEAEAANEVHVAEMMASVPERYRHYITLLEQDKRVGGSKQNPLFAKIKTAYMQVDGRVRMFVDEHRERGAKFDIEVSHHLAGDNPFTMVQVVSELFGKTQATAKVGFGGNGADKTNPIENAETSALGRALGFMGYGLLGGGIASAEEVEGAIKEREGDGS